MKQQRNTKQRKLILEAVRARCGHPTADEIYIDVRNRDATISRGTVYRNLKVLSDNKEIYKVKIGNAERFEGRLDQHYHMLCKCCGKIEDAPIPYHPEYDEEASMQSDFLIDEHQIIFTGICKDCRK